MKKTIALIILVILLVAVFASCDTSLVQSDDAVADEALQEKETQTVSDEILPSDENTVIVKLGDTGYSMVLTGDFEKMDFFDVENVKNPNKLIGVYENNKSLIMIYAGKAENTIEEEINEMFDEVNADDDDIYTPETVNNIEYFSYNDYEYASFDADIIWPHGEEGNVKVSAVKSGDQGASVYYFIPRGDEEETAKRETILSGELIENK